MSVSPEEITRAVAALRAGALVAFPTETVYGLGADASSLAALARLYEVKGRPADHPVIVHVADGAALDDWAVDVPDAARRLADAFWPGPLTLVLRRAPGVLDAVTGGQDTVGVRVPDQPVAFDLLRAFGGGIAAPSANRFGRVSPTTAADVRADLGDDVAAVLDGGPCRVGVESTIVDCTSEPMRVLRLGGIGRGALEGAAEERVEAGEGGGADTARAPGTLASHYAPTARVRILEPGARLLEVIDEELDRGRRIGVIVRDPLVSTRPVKVLGAPPDADEYAHDLYRMLRDADGEGLDVVIAELPDERGVGAAVADRLRRAAAPRPVDSGGEGT